MNRKTEFLRLILILGSLFMFAYAAFVLGTAWMDSVGIAEIAAIEPPLQTPTPSLSQTPTISPTSRPLRWITPSPTIGIPPTVEQQVTSTPEDKDLTPTLEEFTATSESPIVSPTLTQPIILPTSTPPLSSTTTPTSDAYPGPGETEDPYPGPIETEEPYPGPDVTSTPFLTFTVTSTRNPGQTSPTPTPSLTPQTTVPAFTPTQSATSLIPTPTTPPTTTLTYSETLIISNGAVNQVIWSQDALTLTLATSKGLYLVGAETLQRELILDNGASILSAIYAFNEDFIAAGGGDATIRWWDPFNNKYLGVLQGHLLGVIQLGLPNYGSFLASGSDDATVRVWDISTMYNLGVDGIQLKFTFYEPQNRVTDLAVSGIGEMVAASSYRNVHIWHPITGVLLQTIHQPTGWYTALDVSPDSQTLITAYDGRRLEFWNTQTWERTKFLPINGAVREISYSLDGSYFAIGFEDGRIQIWNARKKFLLADLSGHVGLTSLAFSPSSDLLASSSENGTIRLWKITPLRNP